MWFPRGSRVTRPAVCFFCRRSTRASTRAGVWGYAAGDIAMFSLSRNFNINCRLRCGSGCTERYTVKRCFGGPVTRLVSEEVAVDNCWCVLLSGVRLLAQGLRVPSRASRGTESGRSSWPGVHLQLLLPAARMVCRRYHSCALGNVPSRSLGGRGAARQGTAEGALVHHPRSTPPACPLPLGHRTLPSGGLLVVLF